MSATGTAKNAARAATGKAIRRTGKDATKH